MCASGIDRRSGVCPISWRPCGGVSLHGESHRGMDRRPASHSVRGVHSRRPDLCRDLRMDGVSEARASIRSLGKRGHKGHGHSLQHDCPHRWLVYFRAPRDIPAVHHVFHQSLLPRVCGNLIGVGAMLFLPFMGYLLAYELCDYDASICPYMMADQLSMFFEMQGAMIGLMFLASNYYIWLSMKRIEGVEKVRMTILAPIAMVALPLVMTKVMTDYPVPDPMSLAFLLPLILAPFTLGRFIPKTVSARTVIKIGFLMVVVGDAIW